MKRLIVSVILAGTVLTTGCGGGSSSSPAPGSLPNVATLPTGEGQASESPLPDPESSPSSSALSSSTPSTFSETNGRVAVFAGGTGGTYFSVGNRGEIFISPGVATVDAVFHYKITSSIDENLPSFDKTKHIIGVGTITSDVTTTLNGNVVVSFDPVKNGSFSTYHIAYLDDSNSWQYGLGTHDNLHVAQLVIANGNGLTLTANKPYTVVVYAD